MNRTGRLYEEFFIRIGEASLCCISISFHTGAVILTMSPADMAQPGGGPMSWQPIVVGVDASPEAAGAAAFAFRMSQRAGTSCHLVHAARDAWASVGVAEGVDELWHALIHQARANITTTLKNVVPKELADDLTVRLGRAPLVLKEAVRELGAEFGVLG